MPAEVVEEWLASRRPALLNDLSLRPQEHSKLKGTPLSIQRGQAEAFCLESGASDRWILKKFHQGRDLDRAYLESVGSLLPDEEGFRSGVDRCVLSDASLRKAKGHYHSKALARWLENAVVMPRIDGIDWAAVADEVRDGSVQLSRAQRVAMCWGLTELIARLEEADCCHRDLSAGNVFVETTMWTMSLIDFDSMYHPSLGMPRATTCGTAGYVAPVAWLEEILDSATTWCAHADRFSLAVLNVEFLVLDKGAPLTAEGGMFEQGELRARSGKGLSMALDALRAEYPGAATIFEAAVNSGSFDDCPSPEDWLRFCEAQPDALPRPPKLDQLEGFSAVYFEELLKKRRAAAPLWPAPSLAEMPAFDCRLPESTSPLVTLPPDPWSS